MRYQGGKVKLAKHFAPVLREALLRESDGLFYEPFTGGFNVVPRLGNLFDRAICGDAHPGVITLHKAIQAGWDPPATLSPAEYEWLKTERDWSNPLTAFAAFGCSFGGMEFHGLAGGLPKHYREKGTEPPHPAASARRALLNARPHMEHVEFRHQDFQGADLDLDLAGRAVIYADPPYIGTTGYTVGDFDHARFTVWCGIQAEAGHAVFVAEYTAPEGLRCELVWEKLRQLRLRRKDAEYGVDRLFRVRGFAARPVTSRGPEAT